MVARIPTVSIIFFGRISSHMPILAVLPSPLNTCRIDGPASMLSRFGVDGIITTDILSKPEYNHFHHSDAFRRSAACIYFTSVMSL